MVKFNIRLLLSIAYIARRRHPYIVYRLSDNSLFPRRSSPVVLQATVEDGKDLGMRLLLCEVYASGKGSAMKHYNYPFRTDSTKRCATDAQFCGFSLRNAIRTRTDTIVVVSWFSPCLKL